MADIAYDAVSLATTSPLVLTDVKPRAKAIALTARLYAASEGAAPYPAVVISHALGNETMSREQRYASLLNQNGFAALFIDSFAARRSARWPGAFRQLVVTEAMMLADAFAALRSLTARDEIDPGRIAIAGFGEGGTTAVLSAYAQIAQLFAPCGARFSSHVSYWALTAPRLVDVTTSGAPIALLNGALDTGVSLARAELIAGDLQLGGSPVESVVFPYTGRCWDIDDQQPHPHGFNLANLALQIRPDHTTVDERRGAAVRGLTTRLITLARAARTSTVLGEHDKEVSAQSDQILLRHVHGSN